ncbi:PIG-L family deacetylase [Marinomonas sp. TI.3.20]|uniref:PIG-L family deacetylase n=1 Tax=Marinomonas sp. TI.3.20 TaxID=3121296 RepID=UPI00311FAC41
MKQNDYQYALKPDWQSKAQLNRLNTPGSNDIYTLTLADASEFAILKHSEYTWLLSFSYHSTNKTKQGCVSVFIDEKEQGAIGNSQFFEAKQEGIRYLNLSSLLSNDLLDEQIKLHFKYCSTKPEVTLLGFKKPAISSGGAILIIAPHADDAELAAYGLYSEYSDRTWITTINAGQTLQSLDRQYIAGLDNNLADAVHRKAQIRAWNSMTTPLLAGVKLERLTSLGYFNLTIDSLYKVPQEQQIDKVLPGLTPNISRGLNHITLPNDERDTCTGESLVEDLASLLEQIKPTSVFITDPEIDPHSEHIMSAHALALAIRKSAHKPDNVFMYVNHLRKIKKFPYGPEHTLTALPPWFDASSIFKELSCYSHQLSLTTQKEKVVSFDTMHDLRSKPRLKKSLKKWWHQNILKSDYQFYGYHTYFQTHIRANEVFTFVDGQVFSDALIQSQTQK